MSKGVEIGMPDKFEGFDEWEVRQAANTLTEAVELGDKPKLLAAAKKWIKKDAKNKREAVGLADNLQMFKFDNSERTCPTANY